MLVVGISPLLIILSLDAMGLIDAGNAMGPGILAFFTFYPSLILIIIGSILTYKEAKSVRLAKP